MGLIQPILVVSLSLGTRAVGARRFFLLICGFYRCICTGNGRMEGEETDISERQGGPARSRERGRDQSICRRLDSSYSSSLTTASTRTVTAHTVALLQSQVNCSDTGISTFGICTGCYGKEYGDLSLSVSP